MVVLRAAYGLATGSSQTVPTVIQRTGKHILSFLHPRRVIALVTAPGDGEMLRHP